MAHMIAKITKVRHENDQLKIKLLNTENLTFEAETKLMMPNLGQLAYFVKNFEPQNQNDIDKIGAVVGKLFLEDLEFYVQM